MPGLDHLIAKSLNNIIKQNLGVKTIQKIENRLFEKYGISWNQSLEEFEKLDFVLKELFGNIGAKGLEQRFCNAIFDTKSKKNTENWIIICDPDINSNIIQTFGDLEKKKIIESVMESPKIIYEIIKDCSLPQTSGYRKVNALIDEGFLIPTEFEIKENKRIYKYSSIIKNLKIDISSNKIKASVLLNEPQQNQCSFLQIVTK
ncbi:hypothetical protein [Nitrosarchaeum sp.]|uniref:hypothetical protein n=1 Tax=Nitrosarchaeum sp. TaxID=2026886 RepID=UPI00247CF22D|nr:hypothetical protein [Nitrosarchaeum sp.]MCV0411682.1 hypothetical protein [Nitrosarchaeum sp.]